MSTAKQHWSSEAIAAAFTSQGLALSPGRAERLARGQQLLLEASGADPLLRALDFHADPTTFLRVLRQTK